jgi:hypothetical protein
MDPETLKKRLEPPQQDEDQAEVIKKKIEQLSKEKEKAIVEDPKSEPEYTFDLNYIDARGKAWTGTFTNKILTRRERRQVGIMRSMLVSGRPYESLDLGTRDDALIDAHLAVSLTQKPKWAEKLDDLHDFRIAQAIYEEVLAHEAHFLGLGQHQDSGETPD